MGEAKREYEKKLVGIFVCTLLIAATNIALADWSPNDGHKMHFPQIPDIDGWDVAFNDWWLADDWKCQETGRGRKKNCLLARQNLTRSGFDCEMDVTNFSLLLCRVS